MKNKVHIERSICQAYIVEEFAILQSITLIEPNVICKSRRPTRNDDRGIENGHQIFLFNYPDEFHSLSKIRCLKDKELHAAHTCILRNCPEVQSYHSKYNTITRE